MQQEPKDRIKEVEFDQPAHIRLAKGVETMRKAVGSTYGVGGRNVLIQKKYVHPVLTRDGVTVARDIAGYGNKIKDPVAAEAAKLVYQASEKTNKTAGDGTTATVVLLAALYKAGYSRITAGEDPMKIKKLLDANRDLILDFVKNQSVKCNRSKLVQVAYIASGDKELAEMISDLVWDVGADGAITLNYHNFPDVEIEKVTGYLFDQGFRILAQEAEFASPLVFVTQKRVASRNDIIPFLNLVVGNETQAPKEFVIVGDVAGAALETLVGAIAQQKINGVVIPPPAFGADGHDFFVDIATYTGARLWLESDGFEHVTLNDLGKIKAARISRERAILYGDNSTGDAIAERIAAIQEQLKNSNITPSIKEQLETRYAKLAGKISIVKVGAATDVEREELFFRIEDAVEACKSALSSGIVAGGATTLLFASSIRKQTKTEEQPMLEPFVKDALQEPFRLLMSNAGEDGGFRLNQVLNAGYGQGFDLRNMSEQPTDLMKAGIVDATKVVLQVVKNAFSVAGALLTTGAVVIEEPADVEATKTVNS
jgi:chaperonin GroEL